MSDFEDQVAEIISDAVDRILRLVGGDGIDVSSSESDVEPSSIPRFEPSPRPAAPAAPRKRGTSDPILDNFLGVNQ